MRQTIALVSALLLIVASCAGEGVEPSTTAPSDAIDLVVAPSEYFPVVPGQLFMALATSPGHGDPVEFTASVTGQATVDPESTVLHPGEVAEFTMVATVADVGSTIELEVTAQRGDAVASKTLEIEVVEWDDTIQPLATELRDRFVTYLDSEMPELGIRSETEWTPSITKPQILVVMHYLFFSDEWEMGIMWHVTVPENAWSRMYLRPRTELTPTVGLEIPSYLDPASAPIPWDPPTEVDR